MKGDFSRIRFNPSKHYTSVLQQQGRVSLDADGNEQCAINEHLRDTETKDFVGLYGGPNGAEGFAISVDGTTGQILIGAGRYYVHGILCENGQDSLGYTEQPFLIGPHPTDTELLSELSQGTISVIQVYLQVWRRLVTALDDPCLREPALGQADTTARVQTVWRVIAQGVPTHRTTLPAGPTRTVPSTAFTRTLEVARPEVPPGDSLGNVGVVHQPATPSGGRIPIRPSPEPFLFDCCADMYRVPVQEENRGRLSAQTGDGSADCSCQPTPAAGYRGIENQLYRVEIHQGGDETSATFKWSRENGSVVVSVGIRGVSGRQVYVESLGPDANLGFSVGQWVEIIDDSYLFGTIPNQRGDLYQIKAITPEQLCITMTEPVAVVDPKRHAQLRRWDQFGSSAGSNGVALSAGSWLDLENGIQVQFTPGQYESADYWLIPARTASGQIDWPPCHSNGHPFQLAHRIDIYKAPLACIQWDRHRGQPAVHDCRRPFHPLTELTPASAPPALHISKISWQNDDIMTLDQLVVSGLTVTLDQAPSGPINGSNFIVTFEPAAAPTNTNDARALAITKAAAEGRPSTILRTATIVDSQILTSGATLSWQLPFLQANAAQRLTVLFLDELLSFGAPAAWFTRVRVKLLGRAIFFGSGTAQQFLDGQCFGQAAVRMDGTTPRIDLQLPSGNAEKASDFEGWFYVAPILLLVNLAMNYPALAVIVDFNNVVTGVRPIPTGTGPPPPPVTPKATITVSYPVIADTDITLALSGDTGVGTVASIQPSVRVNNNQLTADFPISILSNPGPNTTLQFTITASLNSALGAVPSKSVSFSVTGVQPPQRPVT